MVFHPPFQSLCIKSQLPGIGAVGDRKEINFDRSLFDRVHEIDFGNLVLLLAPFDNAGEDAVFGKCGNDFDWVHERKEYLSPSPQVWGEARREVVLYGF